MLEVSFSRFDTPRRKRVILSVGEVKTVLENAKRFSPVLYFPISLVPPIPEQERMRSLGLIEVMLILIQD